MAAPMVVLAFCLAALFVGVVTALQLYAPILHHRLNDLVLYGKLRCPPSVQKTPFVFRIPKRCFSHFYIVGFISHLIFISISLAVFGGHWDWPGPMKYWIDLILNVHDISPSLDAFTTLLTLILFTIHILRRLLETLYVHVFSDGVMNLLHYLVGVLFYPAVGLAVLAECPVWASVQEIVPRLTLYQIAGILLLVLSSYGQHHSFRVLASLRKNAIGHVETHRHSIPHGGLFEYVSSPHYLTEITIYIAFCSLQNFANTTFYAVLVFVLTNQIMFALLAHRWYRSKFAEDYPPNRKAVVPFLL